MPENSSNSLAVSYSDSNIAQNGETILDLRLAEKLGYERQADIRSLIKRHLPSLTAMGLVRQAAVPIISGKGRVSMTVEYHLTRPQAAFIIGKARTKRAESCAILMAEVFAMFTEGRLVAVDDAAATDLQAAVGREVIRQGIIAAEEREARSDAFAAMKRSRCRGRRKPKSLTYAAAASW